MLEKLRKDRGEEGFTLIELLVVIIIIGILAAIAIPVFLNQRQKGWDAAVQSDLRNAATAQETYLTENATYTSERRRPRVGRLQVLGRQELQGRCAHDRRSALSMPGNSFCMEAQAAGDPGQWFSYSSPNGMQRERLPVI